MSSKRMVEKTKLVTGLAPITPSTSSPDYVTLKNYDRMSIYIMCDNATTVTGSIISIVQATAVAGTGAKALAFDKVWQNIDTGSAGGDILAETAVTSDTFTTDATNSKNLLYVIEIAASDLDIANDFDCVALLVGDTTAQIVSVLYQLHDSRYKSTISDSVITD